MAAAPLLALVGATLILAWPAVMVRASVPGPPYWFLTGALAATLAFVVASWRSLAGPTPWPQRPHWAAAAIIGGAGTAALGLALVAWTRLLVTRPFNSDMLVVIREATARFLAGHDPYATYSTYDAPWDIVLPYGPLLWGPYLLPRMFQADLRLVTVAGELAVPALAVAAAATEALRGRLAVAASLLGAAGSLLGWMHVSDFTLMGHTPAYWPLLALFAVLVVARRWDAASLALGLLLVARTTTVALVPVLMMAIWSDRRRSLPRCVAYLAVPPLVLFTPFAVWDPAVLWDNMVASYPRIVKAVVWVPPFTGVTETFGLTGWLVAHGLQAWAEASQVVAMLVVYVLAWRAVRSGGAIVPWMAVALTAFSMTALWPLFYLYFDVLLLLTSGAAASSLGAVVTVKRWAVGTALLALAVVGTATATTEDHPRFDFNPPAARQSFAVPRRSIDPAVLVFDYDITGREPGSITAMLNGQVLGTIAPTSGHHSARLPVPRALWWRGFNRLDLVTDVSPPTPLVVSSIAVVAVGSGRP